MKGNITSQKTMWCGKCSHWEVIDNVKHARSIGWKLTKEHGWVCPFCQCKHKNKTHTPDSTNKIFCFDCKRYIN